MRQDRSLRHSRWECKYHVVFIPKYRKKAIFGQIRKELGDVMKRLAEQKESWIEEGHLMPDHVHMMISIPPKYAVSQVITSSTVQASTPANATLASAARSNLLNMSIPDLRIADQIGCSLLSLPEGNHRKIE